MIIVTESAAAFDVKILMTNALDLSLSQVIEMYSLRWQIELFFKELKSTLGFARQVPPESVPVSNYSGAALRTRGRR